MAINIFIWHTLDEVKSHDIDNFEYAPVMPDDTRKIDMVKGLIEVKENQASIENVAAEELEEMFFFSFPFFRSFLLFWNK